MSLGVVRELQRGAPTHMHRSGTFIWAACSRDPIMQVEPEKREEAAKAFHEIAEAAEVLGDEEKRTRWENGEDLNDQVCASSAWCLPKERWMPPYCFEV